MPSNVRFAVIFDIDGVLIDSVPASQYARKQLASKYGFTPKEMADHSKPGRSLRDFYLELQDYRKFDTSFEGFAQDMLNIIFDHLAKHIKGPAASLLKFLDTLNAHDIPIAIGTSAVKRSAIRKLAIVNLHNKFAI